MINKVLATVLACTAYLASNAVDAAEMKILCASGMREVVSELQPELARIAGQQVSISFDKAGELQKRLQGGEIADIAILPRIVLDEVAADGNIVPATIIDISQAYRHRRAQGCAEAGHRLGGAVQAGALGRQGDVVGDPASGGVAAVHVANVFRRLGIIDQLAPKLRLTRDQRNATFVEKGEADIAVQLSNEIRIVPGIEFIAFPPEFARTFVFSAALGSKAKEANVARTILQFLAGSETAAAVEAKGMDRAAAK